MHTCTSHDALAASPSLESLVNQITELSAHIHAASYRLLCLIAEFDRRQGWAQWGVLTCAHWLNWRCGIGLVAAREKLRVAHSLEQLAAQTARRLACDAAVVRIVENEDGMPLDVGRKTRSIPPAIRRALKLRDKGCTFPGCTARHFVEGHHLQHWARGGETRLGNLVQLCRFHHRLVHAGGFQVQAGDATSFVFKRPDGQVIAPVADDMQEHATDGVSLEQMNGDRGLEVNATTSATLWDGTRMDWAMAIEGLLSADNALELEPGARHRAHFPRRNSSG